MYCTRCGKKIEYDSFVCNECRAQEEALLNATKEIEQEPVVEATEIDKQDTTTEVHNTVASEATVTAEVPLNESPTPNEQYQQIPTNQGQPQYQQTPHVKEQPQYQQVPQNQGQSQYYYSIPNRPYDQPYTQVGQQNPGLNIENPRMYGIGKAIASLILAFFGFFFTVISMSLVYDIPVFLGVFLIALGLNIPALILGIGCIKSFGKVRAHRLPPPIATLIMGIIGLSYSGLMLLINLIEFMTLGA